MELSFIVFVGIVTSAVAAWGLLSPNRSRREPHEFEFATAVVLIPIFLWIGHFGWGYFWNPPEHNQMPIVYLLTQAVRLGISLFFVFGATSFFIYLLVVPLVMKVRDAVRTTQK